MASILEQHGFAEATETESPGGFLSLVSSDDHGAQVEVLWKAFEISVHVSGVADLEGEACSSDVVA